MSSIAEIMARDKERKRLEAEMKMRDKLKRQIYIFNKEKASFTRKTQHEINKQKRTLSLLEKEKLTELENYLSVRSNTTEKLYKRQEGVVKDLVKSTDVVRDLLDAETTETKNIEDRVAGLKAEMWSVKKQETDMHNKHLNFRIPDPFKMDKRVENASCSYHQQLLKNKAIEKKIDDSVKLREFYCKEEAKLVSQVEGVVEKIQDILAQTSEIYERRDRAETTKVKVKDHLNKVKDKYERELLSISLQLNEDKKMETFMRTKHKDITGYLRSLREKEIETVKQMVRSKDEYTKAFDDIKLATGKNNMNKIVQDFIEAEEENFAIFHSIGETLDETEALAMEICTVRDHNILMEDAAIVQDKDTADKIKDAMSRTAEYKTNSEVCQYRIDNGNKKISDFASIIVNALKLLKINKNELSEVWESKKKLKPERLAEVLTVIETKISDVLKDFYMVELSTRSLKTWENNLTPDEVMLCRVPSARIQPMDEKAKPPNVHFPIKDTEAEQLSSNRVLSSGEVREQVVTSMLDGPHAAVLQRHASATPANAAAAAARDPSIQPDQASADTDAMADA